MEAGSIERLVGKTIRIKVESSTSEEPKYYHGKLSRLALSYRIWNPEIIYPDGTKEQIDGFRTVRQIDLDEGRVEVVNHPARKL